MFKKQYYAMIESEPYFPNEGGRWDLCETSGHHVSLENLQEEVKKKKWKVGNKWKFHYTDHIFTDDNISYKERAKTLKIKSIKYYCSTEKTCVKVEELKSEENFKETEPSNNVMTLNVNFHKNGKVVKTYTVYTNGNDYMEKLQNYLAERNINDFEDYGREITISDFKKIEGDNIVV